MSEETKVTVGGDSRLALLQQALTDPAIDADKLDKLLAVQERWQDGEARRAFAAALGKFQAECPIVNKGDDAHGKQYARIDRIWGTIQPIMARCGLWITFDDVDPVSDGVCKVRGTLGHVDGYSKPIEHTIALPDQIRGTNAAQRSGSASTYAKRYCTLSALNVVTGDSPQDDDGNAAGGEVITDANFQVLHAAIEATADPEAVLDAVLKFGGVDDLLDYPAALYATALRTVRMKPQAKAAE